jgi:hypothetical protein
MKAKNFVESYLSLQIIWFDILFIGHLKIGRSIVLHPEQVIAKA